MNKIKFEELPLSAEVQRAIADMGFEEASPIQTEAIPVVLSGKDIIGQAQTGTGKTAAFGIPTIEGIDPTDRRVQALILCPTRELAIQVSGEIQKLAKYKTGISVVPIYGGQSYDRQLRALKQGVQIVIGTPGRVMDHIQRGTLVLDNVNKIILDEADEMLDMGFREDIEFVLEKIPEDRQTIFFSATMSKPIMEMTKRYQTDPVIVKVVHQELTVTNIDQVYFEVRSSNKQEVLSRLLDMYNLKSAIIFCNTKRMVDDLVAGLQARGYFADALHGDLNQNQRSNVMGKFRNGTLEILVATDVAARGLDVDNVEAVFNYDLPQDEESYVHRIGRTGRAGKSGRAFSFVGGRSDGYKLKDIMRYTKAKIVLQQVPSLEDVNEIRTNLFFDKVKEVLEKGHLAKHVARIERFVNETDGYTPLDVASALLKMSMKEQKVKEKGAEVEKGLGVTKEGMDRLFITIGKKDRVHPRDLIELLSNNSSIPEGKVGDIDLYDKFSFVEVPSEYTADILNRVGRIEVDGRMVIVEKSQKKEGGEGRGDREDRGDRGGRGGNRGGFGGRFGGGRDRDRDSTRGDRRGGDRGGFRKRRF
ncbi:ATP-dependent RNA helicase DeaD [Pontibacter ummariensis]|uniref:DEAD-box ATP-dependent RNA helicase RhpA n=1 Tax=Pontibacter ummariensis TaxID=1610492 RepID=A0A239FNB1_9BACT|nr:DEAD/DEAH box helicase [Pontibacter ummariensis]PRY11994.1 ATP-dependent RNA helicase DeaD [Pontibacter ummariensis]SNS58370.1 ATP-dependent RNA helicase DeaD [Pontibacter ummariensis]